MKSDKPEDAENTKRRRRRIAMGLIMVLVFGAGGLLRALDNPRLEALRGVDVLGLVVPGLAIGFGLGLLVTALIIRRE